MLAKKTNSMQENPLVSIIMTCYNGQSTIHEAIASIYNQTYKNWELIFIDDGSTDQSFNIVNEINDERVRCFSLKKNEGRGVSYQRGINESIGEFIMFLDCDDWWYSEKVQVQVDHILNNDEISFLGSGLITVKNSKPIGVRCNKGFSNLLIKDLSDPPIAFATICMKKNLKYKYSFDENMNVAQDIDFLQSLCMNEFFSNIDEVLYVYNEGNSFYWNKFKIAWENRKIGLRKYKKKFLMQYYFQITKVNFKILFYFLLFFFRLQDLLLIYRVKSASNDEIQKYLLEKDSLCKKKLEVFNL